MNKRLDYTEANVQKVAESNSKPLGGDAISVISIEIPADLRYGGDKLDELIWNGRGLLLWYEPDEVWDDYLYFDAEAEDGTIVVTDYGAGILSAEEVFSEGEDTEHAVSLRPVYEWMLDEGIEFEDYDND
jgi:hypothetical protein